MKKGCRSAQVISLASRRAARALVHGKELIATQAEALFSEGGDQRGPVVRRDTATLLPFLRTGSGHIKVKGHRRERVPLRKHIIKRAHAREYASDELSVQGQTMIPMTEIRPLATISPMGRASTPAKFRAEMAKRLTSARIVAGYSTKRQAADKLAITLDRYEKWESGRTPVPAQYVGAVCELFNVDANYLFGTEAVSVQSRRTGS